MVLACMLFTNFAFSQTAPPSNLSGSSLRTWLKQNWYDGKFSQMGYNSARSAMYSYIDSENGTVYCVYTGFSQAAANTTYLNPINAEHTVPQSWFGSAEPMRSDVHHLFPTHGSVNSARSNYPFNEINDNSTTTWYGTTSSGSYTTSSSIPSNLNSYSERNGSIFEPREDHKGNLARAIFYFYTMYPTQAGSITNIVSNGDLDVLYQWHLQDPVDATEVTRNDRCEQRQGNRNPYVDYPNLVAQAWGFSGGGGGSAPASPVAQLSASTTTITITWGDVANETAYQVFRSVNGGSYSQRASLSANATTYTDNSVTAGTNYAYYVTASNSNGSNNSNIVSGTPSSTGGGGNGSISELIISEYIEGSSNNKALEIANFTGASVNLSAYSIKKQTNGAGNWGSELSLSGTLANGNVYVIANSSATSTVTAQADITPASGSVTFNGNDPIGLFKNNVLIDVIGNFNGGTTNFAANQTLIRKASITSPSTSYITSQWTVTATDNFSNLGTHSVDGGSNPSPCNTPTGLASSNITTTSFTVSWSAVSGASSYDVEVNGNIVSDNTTNTSVNITGASASTTYSVRVRTNCSSGSSNYTSALSVTTDTPAPTCSGASISSFPYSESFESGFGLWSQGSGDDLNWTRDASGTPSRNTGPSAGADGSYYLFVEASNPNYPSKTTYLDGPCVDLSGQSEATFAFSYHMYGAGMGSLALQASTNGGSSWTTIWNQSGNKGDSWLSASVSLADYLGSSVKLRFVGTTGNNWDSDMAIDNLNISTGSSSGGGGGGLPTNTEVTLTLVLDNYPAETSWTLKNSAGVTIASGNGYSNANSTVTEVFDLPSGCYDFQITDSYGDGICCSYGNGSYALTSNGATLASGGAYGAGETKNFCVGSGARINQVATTNAKSQKIEIEALTMDVYPNPADALVTIQLSKYSKEDLKVAIYSMDGALVYAGSLLKDDQQPNMSVDVSEFESGLYIIKVTGQSFKQVQKLVVR